MFGRLVASASGKQSLTGKPSPDSGRVGRSFGLLKEYQTRRNIKMSVTHLMTETPQYYVTPARPGNFGEHVDFKINLDNWFDENRYSPYFIEETITNMRLTSEELTYTS